MHCALCISSKHGQPTPHPPHRRHRPLSTPRIRTALGTPSAIPRPRQPRNRRATLTYSPSYACMGTWLWRNPRLWHRGLRRSRSIHPSRSHTPKHTYYSITPWRRPHHHLLRQQPRPNARHSHRSFPRKNQLLNTHSHCVSTPKNYPNLNIGYSKVQATPKNTHSHCVLP